MIGIIMPDFKFVLVAEVFIVHAKNRRAFCIRMRASDERQ